MIETIEQLNDCLDNVDSSFYVEQHGDVLRCFDSGIHEEEEPPEGKYPALVAEFHPSGCADFKHVLIWIWFAFGNTFSIFAIAARELAAVTPMLGGTVALQGLTTLLEVYNEGYIEETYGLKKCGDAWQVDPTWKTKRYPIGDTLPDGTHVRTHVAVEVALKDGDKVWESTVHSDGQKDGQSCYDPLFLMHARNALADALEGIDAQIKALPNVPPVFKIEEGGANQTKTSQE